MARRRGLARLCGLLAFFGTNAPQIFVAGGAEARLGQGEKFLHA
jgi:hypothetical protein